MKAALFDLDGVIIDSESIYTEFWGEIERIHPTGIPDFPLVIKGNTLERILNRWFPDAEVQHDILVRLERQEREMRYRVFPGVIEFLDALHSLGIPAAIVTSSNMRKMENLFEQIPGLRDYFDIVITDKDVTRGKPDPQPYLVAAERLGVDPKDCVVFEDSYSGIESGRRAGARVVALATTNPAESLVDKADMVVDSFVGLTPEACRAL